MSFQGDVAGIGLGELLQGLARGGKDGVLNLFGKDLVARIGLQGGQLYLVNSPEEDPHVWRSRCAKAWVKDPEAERDPQRRDAIARAERLETVFAMLEAPNLHFRFEQGSLPPPPGGAPTGSQQRGSRSEGMALGSGRPAESPWGKGMSVEFVLLEHARISDEVQSGGGPKEHDMPRALDPGQPEKGYELLLAECDGKSTMVEVADRLGWPLRQCCGVVNELVARRAVRLATPREILASALQELEDGQYERAADRFEGWLDSTPGGPPSREDGELLAHLWERGQIATALGYVRRRAGRRLCRRLDYVASDLEQSIELWRRFVELHGACGVARLHLTRLCLAATADASPDADTLNELLRQARQLTEAGFAMRARALLLAVRDLAIDSLSVRVDVGHRMLAAGMLEDASEILSAAAREMVETGDLVRARRLIGSLLVEVPEHRAARDLLAEIENRQQRKKRRTWQFAVGASVAVVLSGVGVVHIKNEAELDRRVNEITNLLDDPDRGLALLDEYYPRTAVRPERIVGLHAALDRRRSEQQQIALANWNNSCVEIEGRIERGELLLAVERIVGIGNPPSLDDVYVRRLRSREELLSLIAGKLQTRFETSDPGLEAEPGALQRESELLADTEDILEASRSKRLHSEFRDFVDHVDLLVMQWNTRRTERAQERLAKASRDKEARQDRLLSSARFLAASGELDRSLEAYDQLLEIDADESVIEFVKKERAGIAVQFEAWQLALEEAAAGEHASAVERLDQAGLDLTVFPLPWRVESQPSGAKVTTSDGTVATTPFVMRTPAGVAVEMQLELPGTLPVTLTVEMPQDRLVHLHRNVDRAVTSGTRIEALPILVGSDLVVADRNGSVRRLGPKGEVRWERDLDTLGGIARTPRFLPSRPGWMLVVSEEGNSWLISVEDGQVEGPWSAGCPPIQGPEDLGGAIAVLFNDGSLATWNRTVEPVVSSATSQVYRMAPEEDAEYSERLENLVCLRASTGRDTDMGNPWNAWRVEVEEGMYMVRLRNEPLRTFTAERFGRFSFVAWEKPSSSAPDGRLWISDEGGLRSYRP
ncbi:hypothetical protein Pla163_22450 [Planctomycetes bacterium Pla163]|uniref:PatA-like N-terminal domain-containing protein n=1 Tax=Rohdeia mirabilis TaxID=2528008 RepID=A0A518D0Z1_9BACT|nr:hypothetical protein Pla163_22450 [Planctomycetes bacterium Pla163]